MITDTTAYKKFFQSFKELYTPFAQLFNMLSLLGFTDRTPLAESFRHYRKWGTVYQRFRIWQDKGY